MNVDENALQALLCKRLCEDFRVERRPDRAPMLRAHFAFPDGDSFPIYVSPSPTGGMRLSDKGHTLMHISHEHDMDAFLDGTRGALLERIMAESDLGWGAFFIDTLPDALPKALFHFCQTLTRIHDLAFLFRSYVGSTLYNDLADLLLQTVEREKLHRDYRPDVPNAQAYTVDFRITGRGDSPLFVYGVPNRDKARLTTIILSHVHRHGLLFDSIFVFEDQTQIPGLDLARLSDVGGDMISSLDSHVDFNRKLLQRVARA